MSRSRKRYRHRLLLASFVNPQHEIRMIDKESNPHSDRYVAEVVERGFVHGDNGCLRDILMDIVGPRSVLLLSSNPRSTFASSMRDSRIHNRHAASGLCTFFSARPVGLILRLLQVVAAHVKPTRGLTGRLITPRSERFNYLRECG